MGMYGMIGTSALTEEQQQAMTAAQSALSEAETAVLAEMVAAGALTQEAVDSYFAQQAAQREIASKDYSAWTLDQLSALRQAAGRGGVSETILAGLISQGLLTQAEADDFKLACGQNVNLWAQVDSSKATQGMLTKWQEAQNTYMQALVAAGISTKPPMGNGMGQRNGTNQGENKNGAGGGTRRP